MMKKTKSTLLILRVNALEDVHVDLSFFAMSQLYEVDPAEL